MNFEEEMDKETLKRLQEPEPTNSAIADGIQMILRHLWPQDKLEELIEQKHNALCATCPYRPKNGGETDVQTSPCEAGELAVPMLYDFALTAIKSPWFWIPVATVCAILCAKYGISLPVVGGGN